MQRPAILTVLIVFAVIYFFWPTDIVPDAFGLLGRFDDFLLLFYVYYRYRRWQRSVGTGVPPKEPAAEKPRQQVFDPYEVLEIAQPASQEEIRSAYTRLANQYHPDRVAHLGTDLQKLAHEKMLCIQRAYEELSAR